MERAYNIYQAAELLGLKARTLRFWVKQGKIKASQIEGTRRWFILESEIRTGVHFADFGNHRVTKRAVLQGSPIFLLFFVARIKI